MVGRSAVKASIFQSTLPRRERPSINVSNSSRVQFQSTLPRRERQMPNSLNCSTIQFQSTLPRRERRGELVYFNQRVQISIHAPAKGATNTTVQTWIAFSDFNPRSREGSDHHEHRYNTHDSYFNPRSREGSDLGYLAMEMRSIFISIHAPAKGATIRS